VIRKLLPAFAVAAALLSTSRAHALEDDDQYWFAVNLQAPVVEKLKLWVEPQFRYVPDEPADRRVIARTGLFYPIGAGFSVWAGYAWTPVWNKKAAADGSHRVDEHRPWQQLTHTYERRGVTFGNRLRFEERFIETADSVSLRLRHQVRFQYRPKEWHGFGVVTWDEVFFNMNTAEKGPKSGVDQNRFALAVQYAFNKTFILEPTYVLNGVNARRKEFHTALLLLWINL